MQIPFYQTQWHGIDLVQLAKNIGHSLQTVAGPDFYAAFYKELLTRKDLAASWINKKELVADWLYKKIKQYGLSQKAILSIGAGTGIIEMPLISKGLKIDLQDVQSDSFLITGVNKITTCYIGEISDISKKYDVLISIAACYLLSDDEIKKFFYKCADLLKEKGIFIMLDTSLSWYEVYSWLRNKQHLSQLLLWGKKRSINEILKNATSHFTLKESNYYDDNIGLMDVFKFLNIPLNVTPTWQSLILERRQ